VSQDWGAGRGCQEHDQDFLCPSTRFRGGWAEEEFNHRCETDAGPLAVPRSAADLFMDMLHPAGCRTVVITGGVGRETVLLWDEVAARGMTHLFGAPQPWKGTPQSVDLPTQGVRGKPVLEGFSHDMPEAHIRAHCTEADVFLEIFVSRCKERGFEAIDFGGNPLAQSDAASNPKIANEGAVRSLVYLETASTHTGSNVEFSASTLRKLGLEPSTCAVAVIQHPQLHKRACLTWAKQMGRTPDSILGWTLEPIPAKTGRCTAEMLRYALGELQRLPLYSSPDRGFVDLPEDFPSHLVTSLEAFLI
jgi:hypothetical protein